MVDKAEQRALEHYSSLTSSLDRSKRQAFRNGYHAAEKDLGWHSVEESLPEEKGWYFTCIDDNGTPQALGVTYFDGTEWTDDDDSTENVDYWMPCPKIPGSDD